MQIISDEKQRFELEKRVAHYVSDALITIVKDIGAVGGYLLLLLLLCYS